MTTANTTIKRVRVWVLPAATAGDGHAFPWSLNFVEELRLIPIISRKAYSAMGVASFRLLRAQRDDGEGKGLVNAPGDIVAGQYIAITSGVDVFTLAAIKWWGFISRVDRQYIAGADSVGTVSALQVGHLLDGGGLSGWQQDNGAGDTEKLTSPPTWNMSDRSGVVVGNVTTVAGDPCFTRSATSCQVGGGASYGSRWQLLQHLCTFCVQESLPILVPADTGGAVSAYLNDTTLPEVLDVRDCTLKGAIDLTVPRPRGFGWTVNIWDATRWFIDVYPLISAGDSPASGYPTATGVVVNLDDHQTIDFSAVEDGADLYDSVTIDGARIVHCSGIAMNDNGDSGWSATQETTYRTGTPINSGERPSEWQERNAQLRSSPGLCDVFTRFMVLDPLANSLLRSTLPGEATATKDWFPNVVWTAGIGNLQIVEGTPRDPYWPAARILHTIPWPVGVKADGTDSRDAESKTSPRYLKPRIFRYVAGATPENGGGQPWQDLTVSYRSRSGVEAECDDRGPGLIIRMSPPELLAKGHWTSGTDAQAKIDPNVAKPKCPPIDWLNLVLTVAMESDQRVQVQKLRPGLTAAQVRRDLRLSYDKLECWVVHAGTVLGVAADGTAERVPTTVFTRNDFPVAQRLADMAAAWCFRRRSSGSIVLARPDDPPIWAEIGKMISTVTDAGQTVELNTVVEDISVDWSVDSPRITVTTTLPDRPDFKTLAASASPTDGGSVSASLGGTTAQAVQNLRGQVGALARDLQRLPLIPSRIDSLIADTGEKTGSRIDIYQVAHGFTVGDWVVVGSDGGTGTAWAKATVSNVLGLNRGPSPIDQFDKVRIPLSGVVLSVLDTSRATIVTEGYVEGLTNSDPAADVAGQFSPGLAYGLHASVAGAITRIRNNTGVTCFIATGATSGYVRVGVQPEGIYDASGNGGGGGGTVANPIINDAGVAADPAAITDAHPVSFYEGVGPRCRWGGFTRAAPFLTYPLGPRWLDPANPGALTATRPTTPIAQKPVMVSYVYRADTAIDYHYLLPYNPEKGLGDLWDVDMSAPPADTNTIKWDNTAKRWKAGAVGGSSISVNTISLDKLVKIGPLAILGNNTTSPPATAAVVEIPASTSAGNGQAFVRRTDNTLGFSETVELSTTADGIGVAKVWYAPGKYFLIDTSGLKVYVSATREVSVNSSGDLTVKLSATQQVTITSTGVLVQMDATHKVEVLANAVIKATWPNTNTVTLDPADIVGGDTNLDIKLRKIDDCDSAGVAKHRYILGSDLIT